MKKRFALGLITIASLLVVSYIYADVGEPEPPDNVAPAIIQAPKEPVAPQQAAPAPQTVSRRSSGSIKETNLRTEDQQAVTGTVSCVTPSSLMQPKARFIITDQGGNEIEFIVKTLAVIYDATGNILSLDCLQQGTKVQVNYRALPGDCKEATAVKVLK